MNVLHAKKFNKTWETTYEGKIMFSKLNIHYITKYIVNNKKLVQKLSTLHDGLCYKSNLHSHFPLEQPGTKIVL